MFDCEVELVSLLAAAVDASAALGYMTVTLLTL
jgi:hypothetical protein